jgi:hypothetical protein
VREHSFEHVARAIERALRSVEAQVARTRIRFEGSAHRAGGRSAFKGGWLAFHIEESWKRVDADWARRTRRRPRRDLGEGGAEPQPAPVRPLNPSSLSGGAEARVDD